MRKYLLTIAVATVFAPPAQAADIPVKATPRVVEVAYTWTGVYFGLNAGGVRSDYDWTFLAPSGGSTAAASQSFDQFIAGLQLGVQWQFNSIVLGAEVAFSTTFEKHKPQASSSCSFPPPFDDRCDATKFSGLFTVGPRVGWAPTNRLLLFGTGGYAQAKLATAIRFGGVGVPPAPGAQPITSSEKAHHGWYAGGGAEFAITPNWSVGVEYQHVDLNAQAHCVGNNCAVPSILNRNVKAEADLVRVRMNLRPDWPRALSPPWGG